MHWQSFFVPTGAWRCGVLVAAVAGAVACTPYPTDWDPPPGPAPHEARAVPRHVRPHAQAHARSHVRRAPVRAAARTTPPVDSTKPSSHPGYAAVSFPADADASGEENQSASPVEVGAARSQLDAAKAELDRLSRENDRLRDRQLRIRLAQAHKGRLQPGDMDGAPNLAAASAKVRQQINDNVAAWTQALRKVVAANAALRKLTRQP